METYIVYAFESFLSLTSDSQLETLSFFALPASDT